MLENKNAVVYGAGGSLGATVAKTLASAGARVFLTGRSSESLQIVAGEIQASGGWAEVAVVDAYDQNAIESHVGQVASTYGSIDISFNAVGLDVLQNVPLIDMQPDEYLVPVENFLRTRFLTATAAGRLMKDQGSGVILFLTATPGGIGYPYTGGFAAACTVVENLSTNLAAELGIYGIRVVTIRSGGSPDSRVFQEAVQQMPEEMAGILRALEDDTMLKRQPLMQEIANVALFLSSYMASAITGVTVDVTAGTTASLNYRTGAQSTTFGKDPRS
jgi:3-oxoacyl-[acyl-carrier protein] reductase